METLQVGNKQVLYAVQDNSEYRDVSLVHLFSKGNMIGDVLASRPDFLFPTD